MLSVIVPLYNEEDNVAMLHQRLRDVLDGMAVPYEIICVNDGSKDATEARLAEQAQTNEHLKVINFRGNRGQTAAMMAGFDHARGDIIIPIDGDLQNDPADIPRIVEKLNEGYDVVSGWRKSRQDAALRRNLPSKVANWLISHISGVKLHDYGCTLKGYRREVMQDVRLYGEMHRFIPIYASWNGSRITEIPVNHFPRIHGVSKYGLERIVKVLLDLMVVKFLGRYQTKPVYVFGFTGLIAFGVAGLSGLWALWLKFVDNISLIQTPLPLLTVMGFLTGMMCLLMGLLAEVLVRIYFEGQGKSVYQIRNTINFKD